MMYRRKRTATLVVLLLMLLGIFIYAVWAVTGAKADGPPDDTAVTTTAPSDDPCFRQDIECYGYPSDEVECDNNVFVPRNPDGTWTCPGEQLPEEVIGSARGDCPDGQVSYVTDVQGHYICLPPADQVSRGGSHPYGEWLWDFVFRIVQIMLGFA